VFEIAKELSVQSKAIVTKCQAEQIPGIKNHMSSVSAGLEATIREWFAGGESEADASAGGTAVETSAKVDLSKARVAKKKRTAKKAAAKKAAVSSGDSDDSPPEGEAGAGTGVAAAAPAPGDDGDGAQAPAKPTDAAASAQTEEGPAESKPDAGAPEAVEAKGETGEGPGGSAPTASESPESGEAAPGKRPPQMNVPQRPDVVKPAGQHVDAMKKTPAKLSGPKVVRVEAPDVIEAPRQRRDRGPSMPTSRGPRGGGGAGFVPGPPPGEMPPGPGDRRGRNKRRGGGEGEADTKRRRGGGGAAGGGGAGGGGGSGRGGAWRYQDLVEREERLSRSEGFLRQRRRDQKMKSGPAQKAESAAKTGGTVKITAPFTIKDLSAATGVKGSEIVKKLFLEGVMTNVNAHIDTEKATELMLDWNIDLEVQEQATGEAAVIEEFESRETTDERPRSPVVTILGHVDHGKTSLLDRIRRANVAAGEAGGITQATSAFLVDVEAQADIAEQFRRVCFLDTPGHEAFTEMRSRGATMTDIVVLVVAADDGVMPQTVESINHAKAAGVPIIVALNKIDIPGVDNETNVQKIYGQLVEQGLNPSAWGGDTEVIKVSAEKEIGIDTLLETIALTAELLEPKADFAGSASGTVIESQMIEGRGATANLLVQQGELKVGDFVVAGRGFGRVRDLTNDRGERVREVGPSTPVQLSGIDELPSPGDKFYVVKTLRKAEQAASQRRDEERQRALAQPKMTLDSMFAQMGEAEKKELLVVLKADVQGSIDAIKKSIEDISTDEINIRVLHSAVGGITESDVTLASASNAIVFGFNVIPSAKARQSAEQKGVELRAYRVIYDIVDDVKKAAAGLLTPEVREEVLGHAEVRKVFKVSGVGAIAGCYVTDGTIERNAFIRVTRDDIVIEQDRLLEQLKRFKDDAKEVRSGQECGMKIVGYDDIKEGDILECFRKTEVAREL
jgi:translation initiation factor IF-2